MEREERSDRFTALEDWFAGYPVYDPNGEKIGKVDDLFVDENDQPEYIGVKMGFLGTRSTLIPWQLAREDEANRRIDVSVDKDTVKHGPAFDDDREITPEFEREVYSYYGLQSSTIEEHSDHETSYSNANPNSEEHQVSGSRGIPEQEERYTAEEVARRGREVYERYIRREVESNNQGRFLVLDIESAKYALSDKELEAFELARKKAPHGVLYLLRVGHRTAHRTGVRFVSDSRR